MQSVAEGMSMAIEAEAAKNCIVCKAEVSFILPGIYISSTPPSFRDFFFAAQQLLLTAFLMFAVKFYVIVGKA